ncbi:MAG: hypothetical protein JJLCMIEE_01437 [Acidimicrobiales bacterium]|nr:MAG: VOC family protein [Actinomycetota bacterium]MBV6508377.1 hypothetical protein [Acidimicrobiales bacterium]RIK04806.1 MAG: VOC family protein [Acidobacteriota bacterium]
MAFHHVALATTDAEATHDFYTRSMGFTLAKVEAIPTPNGTGWAKHLFYNTGDGMIAFWELHDETLPSPEGGMSEVYGLPLWVNHLAFRAEDNAHLDHCRQRWLDNGIHVTEVDHHWCVSIYAVDPNGHLVEWCLDTRALTDQDREQAQVSRTDPNPQLLQAKEPKVYKAPRNAS